MAQLKISKVTALPGVLEASTLYLVSDAARVNDVNIYVSDSTGSAAKHVPTFGELETMVDGKVSAAVSAAAALTVLTDITARDALTPTATMLALVLDATGDTSVASGAATYVYNPGTTAWVKISEYESLDVIMQWANITGRPTSAVADIDDAVTKRHAHTNIAVLDLLDVAGGNLTYNGAPVTQQLLAEEW